MKKILLLTDYYYPYASANGICIERLATEFVKQGLEVHIVSFGDSSSDSETHYNGTTVHRVQPPLFFRFREKKERGWLTNKVYSMLRITRFIRILIFIFRYPLVYPGFALRYWKCVKAIIEKQGIDTIIAEYVPIEAVYAGVKAKSHFSDISLEIYVVDTFTQCPNAKKYFLIRKASQRWEMKLIRKSDAFFYIENHKEYYSNLVFKDYYKKLHPTGLPLINNNYISQKVDHDCITFLYTGAWGGERNPHKIMESLAEINKTRSIHFSYCGKDNDLIHEMQKRYSFISNEGFRNSVALNELYKTTDILINIGNSSNMLPSKLFAYMSTGLPIMHFYLNKQDPCLELLKHYGCSSCISLNEVSSTIIDEEVERINGHRVPYEIVKKYYSHFIPELIANEMISI